MKKNKHLQRTMPSEKGNSIKSRLSMAPAEDSGQNLKKRKLTLLDFLKNTTPDEAPDNNAHTEPSRSFTPPLMSFKRSRNTDHENGGDESDTGSEKHVPFRPIDFTRQSAITFTKGDPEKEVEDKEDEAMADFTAPKLSYSELQSLENTVRTQTNTFKGKKYGIGASLLKKMGYVEGQGLGKNGQGITKPIEQGLRKPGVGIGGGSLENNKDRNNKRNTKLSAEDMADSEDSSDEEYYRDVPKKSLFQIIVDIESNGVKVSDKIKNISSRNTKDSNKPFIELKKEGNTDLEALTHALDTINKELDDLSLKRRYNESEIVDAQKGLDNINTKESLYSTLSSKMLRWRDIVDSNLSLHERSSLLQTELQNFDIEPFREVADVDIDKAIVLSVKPIIEKQFEDWSPMDISDTSLIDELAIWKEKIPEPKEIFGELSYFQSLIYSLWYPKITRSFEDWSVDQPNVAITLLLDWGEVVDESVIDYFVSRVISPKIIQGIQDWDPQSDIENPPYIWIFEWLPYLTVVMDEIIKEFESKYKTLFDNWSFRPKSIDGLHSMREIMGESRFMKLIKHDLIPNIIKYFMNCEFKDWKLLPIGVLFDLHEFIGSQKLDGIIQYGLFNSWFKFLFNELSNPKVKRSEIAQNIDHFYTSIEPYLGKSSLVSVLFGDGLDMVNKFIDDGKLELRHISLPRQKIVDLVLNSDSGTAKIEARTPSVVPVHKIQATFKEVIQDFCDQNNLFFQPLKNDLSAGHLLFRISRDPTSKNGLVLYIEEDVIWVRENDGTFTPVSLDTIGYRV